MTDVGADVEYGHSRPDQAAKQSLCFRFVLVVKDAIYETPTGRVPTRQENLVPVDKERSPRAQVYQSGRSLAHHVNGGDQLASHAASPQAADVNRVSDKRDRAT